MPELRQLAPLDAFMQIPLDNLHLFTQASSTIRDHLHQAEGVLIEPLRGAAPLDWSARGLADIEASPTDGLFTLQIPSGVGTHVRTDTGATRFGRLYRGVRKNIIRQYLATLPDDVEGITILDEVQLGGTVTRMANMCVTYAMEHGAPLPVKIISGESIEAMDQQRDRYKSLVAGNDPHITVSPVPLPMVYAAETYGDAHNRALVPGVIFSYEYGDESRTLRSIEVDDNPEAALLFRMVGSMSRNPTLAQDRNFVLGRLEGMPRQAAMDDTAAWVDALAAEFSK